MLIQGPEIFTCLKSHRMHGTVSGTKGTLYRVEKFIFPYTPQYCPLIPTEFVSHSPLHSPLHRPYTLMLSCLTHAEFPSGISSHFLDLRKSEIYILGPAKVLLSFPCQLQAIISPPQIRFAFIQMSIILYNHSFLKGV